ncbi:hypothetical protein [Enterococcus faecalis]|uniref:hypothetical protein n=1 Tax=Enterococcus faecalis TaxID=1351 RepID=UPI0034CF0A2D
MVARKKYDYYGIEIKRWNGTNIVAKIDCDCGQLATRIRGIQDMFECQECGRVYHKQIGEYVLYGRKDKREGKEHEGTSNGD